VFAKSRTSLANRYKRFGIQTVAAIVAIIMKGKVQSDAYKLSYNKKAQGCNISFVIKVPEVSEECHFSCVLNRAPVLFSSGGGGSWDILGEGEVICARKNILYDNNIMMCGG